MSFALFSVAASGQEVSGHGQPASGPGLFFGYQPSGYRSSTAAEGFLNGAGNLLWGAGSYNLATSQAGINRQVARNMAIHNREDSIRAYYDAKQANAEYRQSLRKPAGEKTVASNLRPQPNRLSSEQFDRRNGIVIWPAALRTESFATLREKLDQLAASMHPGSTDNQPDRTREIRTLTSEMKEQLKGAIDDLSPSEYMAARKFLDALANELVSGNAAGNLAAHAPS
jgi:hypothetical protein